MCFTRDFITILKNQNNDLYKIDSQNGLTISKYNSKNTLIYSKRLFTGSYTFIDYWFDIDNNDTVYGLINNKEGALTYIQIKGTIIIKKHLIDYDINKAFIKFVYLKKSGSSINLLYYYADKTSPLKYNLVHYYKNITGWHKNIVDQVNITTLTNYIVLSDSHGNMSLVYLKLCNKYEELFISFFDSNKLNWSHPIQITNSHHNKIYLSALIDKNNKVHILFSEKNLYKYQCTYICGFINSKIFNLLHYYTLGDCTACSFPSIIQQNSRISAQWIEYSNLYMCSSNDSGNAWSPVLINPESCSNPFTCCNYKSNTLIKDNLNYYSVLLDTNTFKILGIDK